MTDKWVYGISAAILFVACAYALSAHMACTARHGMLVRGWLNGLVCISEQDFKHTQPGDGKC